MNKCSIDIDIKNWQEIQVIRSVDLQHTKLTNVI